MERVLEREPGKQGGVVIVHVLLSWAGSRIATPRGQISDATVDLFVRHHPVCRHFFFVGGDGDPGGLLISGLTSLLVQANWGGMFDSAAFDSAEVASHRCSCPGRIARRARCQPCYLIRPQKISPKKISCAEFIVSQSLGPGTGVQSGINKLLGGGKGQLWPFLTAATRQVAE